MLNRIKYVKYIIKVQNELKSLSDLKTRSFRTGKLVRSSKMVLLEKRYDKIICFLQKFAKKSNQII